MLHMTDVNVLIQRHILVDCVTNNSFIVNQCIVSGSGGRRQADGKRSPRTRESDTDGM